MFSALLTEDEKWFFDHHGFLILRQVVSPSDVAQMREIGLRWHSLPLAELPPPLTSTSDMHYQEHPNIARWINRIEYGDEVFQRLVLNREILRVVIALTHGYPTLVDTALTKNTTASDDIHFHQVPGGYRIREGEPFADFVNAGISLVNVPPGTGFVCIPGSHKDHYPAPESLAIYDDSPSVWNVSVRAGDCVLFTEALRHGARRWTESSPRLTIFNRYRAGVCEGRPIPAHRAKVSDDVYELGQSMEFGQQKQVVRRFLEAWSQESVLPTTPSVK